MRAAIILAVVTVAAAMVCADGTAAQAGKIVFVNIEKVFDQYLKTQEINEKLDMERKEKIARRKEMVEEINKLKDEADLLRDDAKAKKQEVIDRKVKELYQFEEKVKREALKRRARYQEEILDEVQKAIDEIGKKGGYDAVIPFTGDDLGYHAPSLDVTDKVVKILNDRYRQKK